MVDRVFENGTVRLVTIDDNRLPLLDNGHRLQLYRKPISKDAFILQITADPEYQLTPGQELLSASANP